MSFFFFSISQRYCFSRVRVWVQVHLCWWWNIAWLLPFDLSHLSLVTKQGSECVWALCVCLSNMSRHVHTFKRVCLHIYLCVEMSDSYIYCVHELVVECVCLCMYLWITVSSECLLSPWTSTNMVNKNEIDFQLEAQTFILFTDWESSP